MIPTITTHANTSRPIIEFVGMDSRVWVDHYRWRQMVKHRAFTIKELRWAMNRAERRMLKANPNPPKSIKGCMALLA